MTTDVLHADFPVAPPQRQSGLSSVARSDRLKLILLLCVAALQSVLYIAIVPPWQHYDEPTHFEHAWLIANRGTLPQPNDVDPEMRREVLASMQRYEFFGRGDDNTPPIWINDTGEIWLGVSELTHPPAYYAYLSLLLAPLHYLDVTTQLYIARAMTALLYLATLACLYGVVAELTPRGHALRWFVPLVAMLIGPFANQMTAVNNDSASAFALSLFLWIAVRLVRHGFSFFRIVTVLIAAVLAVFSKNTTALAVGLLPLVFILTLWLQFRLPWKWFWAIAISLLIVVIPVFFGWGDAASWYRYESNVKDFVPSRVSAPAESPYPYAMRTAVDSDDSQRKLLNWIPASTMTRIKGTSVTVGGWVWADQTDYVYAPGLFLSNINSVELYELTRPFTVTNTPTFVINTYVVPEEARVGYYSFFAKKVYPEPAAFDIYTTGAFLIEGAWPENVALPEAGQPLPPEVAARNMIRNPDGEGAWPRLRGWVVRVFEQYARRSPTYLFDALVDVERSVPIMFYNVAPYLLTDFLAGYGWGHVRLTGSWLSPLSLLLVVFAFGGFLVWLVRGRGKRSPTLLPAVSTLAVAGALVWIGALTWPLPFSFARLTLPSARYTFAAIVPTILFLAGGWWMVWNARWRTIGITLLLGVLLVVNLMGVWRIITFYQGG